MKTLSFCMAFLVSLFSSSVFAQNIFSDTSIVKIPTIKISSEHDLNITSSFTHLFDKVNKINQNLPFEVEFQVSQMPGQSSAQVIFRGEKNKCIIYIEPHKIFSLWPGNSAFEKELSFFFVLLHESGHCHLYAKTPFFWNQKPSNVMNSFIELDAWLPPDERASWFASTHEQFADLFAINHLLDFGYSIDDLKFIQNTRSKLTLNSSHHTKESFLSQFFRKITNKHSFSERVLIANETITQELSKNPSFFVIESMSKEQLQESLIQQLSDLYLNMWFPDSTESHAALESISKYLGWLGTSPHHPQAIPFSLLKNWFFNPPETLFSNNATSLNREQMLSVIRNASRIFVTKLINE